MRAIVYTAAGGPDVLRLVDRPAPQPGPGEVRVRIHVSGVNPTDWKARASTAPSGEQVPGQDGAGVVDAVGAGVPLSVGDRVWVWDAAYRRLDGSCQEQVVLPLAHVLPLPAAASFDVGASLGIPALTAHLALRAADRAVAPLAQGALAGLTVLVAGGAGAVGHAAVQLARWSGAIVVATVSSDEKRALATAAGADVVIDYRSEDLGARLAQVAPNGVDRIVEVNPAANAAVDARAIRLGGTIACYASDGGPLSLDAGALMGRNASWRFLLTYTAPEDEKAAALAGVQAALEDGALQVGAEAGLPLTRFPLERAADAQQAVADGALGKVLVDVA